MVIRMTQIEILREINEIIDRLKGVDDFDLRHIGISMESYLNPTLETLRLLQEYEKSITKKGEKIESLEL